MANLINDRIRRMENRIADVFIKTEIIMHNLKKSGEWDESEHPRAEDGKFGNGSSKDHSPEPEKTKFSPVSHIMAEKILSRTDKERTKNIKILEKMPKPELEQRAAKIQQQLNDAFEEQKKDLDNPKWKVIREALSRIYGDVTAAIG